MLPSLVRLAGCRKRAHPAKYGLCRPCHIGFELRIVQEGRSRPTVVDEAVVQAATNRARIEVESMASTKRKDACDPATKQNAVEELDAPIFDPSLELSLIHISEPTRLLSISYAVFCLKKKK